MRDSPPEPGHEYIRTCSYRRYKVGDIFRDTWGLAVIVRVVQKYEIDASHSLESGYASMTPLWDLHLRRLTPEEETVYSVLHG